MSVTYKALYLEKTIAPDSEAVSFVAKVQKTKTRKGKDYFIYRMTIPKEMAKEIGLEGGDYLFLRAKKAQWYHMLDWKTMGDTWRMLPQEIRDRIIIDGFCNQNVFNEAETFGATNLTALPQSPIAQIDAREAYHGSGV